MGAKLRLDRKPYVCQMAMRPDGNQACHPHKHLSNILGAKRNSILSSLAGLAVRYPRSARADELRLYHIDGGSGHFRGIFPGGKRIPM